MRSHTRTVRGDRCQYFDGGGEGGRAPLSPIKATTAGKGRSGMDESSETSNHRHCHWPSAALAVVFLGRIESQDVLLIFQRSHRERDCIIDLYLTSWLEEYQTGVDVESNRTP